MSNEVETRPGQRLSTTLEASGSLRRQIERIVFALLGALAQFDVALGRGLRVELEQILGARSRARAVGRDRQRFARQRLEIGLLPARGEHGRKREGGERNE